MARHVRERGSRTVVGYQGWHDILFVHWPVAAESLRASVDRRLEIDRFEGIAYVSLTPFTVRGARLRGAPPLPFLRTFHELNLRTYVRTSGGDPGVWFFSLDAASALAAALARTGLGLPYCAARISRSIDGRSHEYRSDRVAPRPPASFSARWSVGEILPDRPGSLERFLVERYALYAVKLGRLLRVRVRHPPWVLQEARVERLAETVSAAAGIAPATDHRLAQFSTGVEVEFLAPELP
jgi:uncharacterized protein YqjF (DUF2071 family)